MLTGTLFSLSLALAEWLTKPAALNSSHICTYVCERVYVTQACRAVSHACSLAWMSGSLKPCTRRLKPRERRTVLHRFVKTFTSAFVRREQEATLRIATRANFDSAHVSFAMQEEILNYFPKKRRPTVSSGVMFRGNLKTVAVILKTNGRMLQFNIIVA